MTPSIHFNSNMYNVDRKKYTIDKKSLFGAENDSPSLERIERRLRWFFWRRRWRWHRWLRWRRGWHCRGIRGVLLCQFGAFQDPANLESFERSWRRGIAVVLCVVRVIVSKKQTLQKISRVITGICRDLYGKCSKIMCVREMREEKMRNIPRLVATDWLEVHPLFLQISALDMDPKTANNALPRWEASHLSIVSSVKLHVRHWCSNRSHFRLWSSMACLHAIWKKV